METHAKPDRSQYPVRLLHFDDPDFEDDDDLSAATTVAERLTMMWTLAKTCWLFMGQPRDAARLQRHVVQIQRRWG